MVPVGSIVPQVKLDGLIQSVDLSVRDVLASQDDPFAASLYLWHFAEHGLVTVNGDSLSCWGDAWVQRTFVDGALGPRQDDEIAAASLAVVADRCGQRRRVSSVEIEIGLLRVLNGEIQSQMIPLRHPTYAAILLLAAVHRSAEVVTFTHAVERVADAFTDGVLNGYAFGMIFVVRLLQATHQSDRLEVLRSAALQRLLDPHVHYEEQLYLVQGLLSIDDTAALNTIARQQAEQIVESSPVWPSLMLGVEEIRAEGSPDYGIQVSHLYRVTLLDTLLRLRKDARRRFEDAIDARYRGRRIIGMSSFGFSLTILALLWIGLGLLMEPSLAAGAAYWTAKDYQAMSRAGAAAFLAGCATALLLALLSPVVLWTTWSLFVWSSVESDRRIAEVLLGRCKRVVQGWALVVVLAALINLLTGVASESFWYMLLGA